MNVPATRPRQSRTLAIDSLLRKHGAIDGAAIIGVRGYYLNTMGAPGVNDFGIYDDALIVVSPDCWVTFNGNTDPSTLKPRVAVLRPGAWRYRIGIHGLSKPPERRYKALVQAAPVTVDRHQAGPDTGLFGINIHRGGYRTTSSEGCQTVHPTQWPAFLALVEDQLKRHQQKTVPYLLILQSDL